MQAELERLRAENAQLKNKDKGGLTLKVSEKGGLSLYGMGRFPVTLYKEQWLRILGSAAEIEAFINENDSKLKAKEYGIEAHGSARSVLSMWAARYRRVWIVSNLLFAQASRSGILRRPA